jgi:hypothetical protein
VVTAVNAHLLIDTIVQQTMVFIAQLATAGGVRAPLARVADQVFLELTRELGAQGLKKKVIADMFGMGLRTYRRRVQSAEQSKTVAGKTVWEAVFEYLKDHEPVSGADVLRRFGNDDPEIVSGVLNDFAQSGLVYRAGRGERALYRIAPDTDFGDDEARARANAFLVWLTSFREGPVVASEIAKRAHLSPVAVDRALGELLGEGKVTQSGEGENAVFTSDHFEVLWDSEHGWEAAVLDHFQAMVHAITLKLGAGSETARLGDTVGGSTWSFDVWPGHPFESEAKGVLAESRQRVETLRERIDAFNAGQHARSDAERVVVYLGQYVQALEANGEKR